MNRAVANTPSDGAALALALLRPDIRALEPYRHASFEPGLERLHANENPWRYAGDGTRAGLNRYPEPQPTVLEGKLAAFYGVEPAALLAGRGSDEGIDLLTRAFCAAGHDAVLICPPTFGMYAVCARLQGAAVLEVPLKRAARYALDEAAVLTAATPPVKLLWLCSPNNPTGQLLEPGVIERLLERLSGRVMVVIDEAYVEFSGARSWLSRLAQFPHLIVLRTLSKAYALAGARLGVVFAHPALIEVLRRVRPPYAIGTPVAEAVEDALAPAPLTVARERVAELVRERSRLGEGLRALPGVRRVFPSDANFLLIEADDPPLLLARARAAGLLLRDLSGSRWTPGCLRISIGAAEQNDRLLASLKDRP